LEDFSFFHILGIIFPTDELIFFRGVGIPPTRYYSILFPYQGKIYRKTPYLMGKTMVSCRCSLKPSH
jgi:hypothetical protein